MDALQKGPQALNRHLVPRRVPSSEKEELTFADC